MTRVDHRFAAMGGAARVILESNTRSEAELERHAAAIRSTIEDVEAALSRFRSDSELSALNRDPRPAVPSSPLLRHFALAVRSAGARSGGLVDATLLAPLERQGYTTSRAGVAPAVLDEALAAAPPRRPARPHPARAHAGVGVDEHGRVVRPPRVRLDSGGLGKGLAADPGAIAAPTGIRYAISCGGDLAIGGATPASPWEVAVHSARMGTPVAGEDPDAGPRRPVGHRERHEDPAEARPQEAVAEQQEPVAPAPPDPSAAPTEPMPVAAPSGYRPLWARNSAPPPG